MTKRNGDADGSRHQTTGEIFVTETYNEAVRCIDRRDWDALLPYLKLTFCGHPV